MEEHDAEQPSGENTRAEFFHEQHYRIGGDSLSSKTAVALASE